ncbi:MAG: OmpA family protein [Candidatus Acidiferrales bacterium]
MPNRGVFSPLLRNLIDPRRPRRLGRCAANIALAAGLMAAVVAVSAAPAAAQETPMTVQLTSSLNSGSVHKGDVVTAQVTSPAAFQGDTVQGRVSQTGSSHGQAVVVFTLETLRHAGIDVAIMSTIQAISNSKGQAGVDEQGTTINATTLAGKDASHGSRWGSNIGGLIGGRSGEAVGDASDASGTKATPPSIQIAAQAAGFQLGAGATFGLSVKSNGGADLASLPPNAGGSASAVPAPSAAAPSAQAAMQQAATSPQPAAAATGGQPDLKSTPIDFVPGERTIFFDDFSDMDADEPPPHWKVRGGTVALSRGGGISELDVAADTGVTLTSGTIEVPANFTFQMIWTGGGQIVCRFHDKDGNQVIIAQVRGEEDGQTASAQITAGDELGGSQIKTDTSKPVEFDLWAQQGRIRAYLNGQRVEDANQVEFAPIVSVEIDPAGYRPNSIRMVRVAESAPDFSSVINSTGKYITHGINFDTDSDVLKPDSAAVLKQVAAGLNKNPNLKLEIDGYTDSVGNAAHNIDLSKRRAQAVMAVLVSQFGIDASRLSANGFGAAKPIGSNDTPDGRASNRRVEFIKK